MKQSNPEQYKSKVLHIVAKRFTAYRAMLKTASAIDEVMPVLDRLGDMDIDAHSDWLTNKFLEDIGEIFGRVCFDEVFRFQASLDRIFPDKVAVVNVPEGIDIDIPSVNRWQRSLGITDRGQAANAYIELTQRAKQGVIDDFEEISISASSISLDSLDIDLEKANEATGAMELLNLVDEFIGFSLGLLRNDNPNKLEMIDMQCRQIQNIQRYIRKHPRIANGQMEEAFIEAIVDINREKVKDIARDYVRQLTGDILTERLELLKGSLESYVAAPRVATDSMKATTKRKRKSGADKSSEPVAKSREIKKSKLKPGEEVFVNPDEFAFVDGEIIRPVLQVENGPNGATVVIDMRTAKTLDIEHKMTGYETEEKRQRLLPIINDKLQLAARSVVSARDFRDVQMPSVDNRDTSLYDRPILCQKEMSPNAKRVYVSILKVDSLMDSDMKTDLAAANIENVVLFLGACDKARQIDLLSEFTGLSRASLRAQGAGSQ